MNREQSSAFPRKTFLLSAAAAVAASQASVRGAPATGLTGPADIIYTNAHFITMNDAAPSARALAVKNGRIIAVGSIAQIGAFKNPSTVVVDLQGKTVVPGLIDAHCHPMETIMMKETWVDCRFPETPSVARALATIAAWAQKTPKGQWIFVACVSASENKFKEKRLPTKAELDAAAPDNPLLLANGTHMCVANTPALLKLGIAKGTTTLPHGGSVLLDASGEPTGVLTDAQADVPTTPTVAQLESYYTRDIQQLWNSYGFTSVLAITPSAALPVLQGIAKSGPRPTLRYATSVWTSSNGSGEPSDLSSFAMPRDSDPEYYEFLSMKVWVDGENDCRTGYMYQPYVGHHDTDPPGGLGTLVTPQADANRFAHVANANGVGCMMHTSGDHAVDIALAAYENQCAVSAARTLMRIEHFGIFQMSDRQLARAVALKAKGMYVSVQPTWMLDLIDADYENMGAPRTETGFRFRTMIDAGLEPAAGTDVTGIYLDNINPFLAIYASVTRQSDHGIFLPEEAVSVDEALKMWTIWAARSMNQGAFKGSLEPGKLADMAVLSDNVLAMPPEGLKDVKVLKTVVGGAVVYEAA